jgi:hypothetical protein
MASLTKNMADDPRFSFMEQDITNGNGGSWDTFVSNVETAADAIKALTSKESIGIREF